MRTTDLRKNKWIIVLIATLIVAFIILLIVLITKNGNGGQNGTENQAGNPAGNPAVINDSFALNPFVNANVGDIVKFGSYEQDNNTENGAEPIEWQVLEIRAELRLKWNNGKQVSENHGVLRGFFFTNQIS